MGNWVTLAFLSLFANAMMITSWQRLAKFYAADTYLFYTWFITAIVMNLIDIPDTIWTFHVIDHERIFLIVLLALMAGLFSWSGNYFYAQAIERQTNLGYIESITSIRVGLTYIVSLLWLSDVFSVIKLIGICCCVIGVILVANDRSPGLQPDLRRAKSWVIFSLLSGIMFSLLIIFSRLLNSVGVSAISSLKLWSPVVAILYFGSNIRKRIGFIPKKSTGLLVTTGVLSVIAQLSLFTSYALTPNLGYTSAISNSRLIVLWIISVIFGGAKLENTKITGLIISFFGILLIAV